MRWGGERRKASTEPPPSDLAQQGSRVNSLRGQRAVSMAVFDDHARSLSRQRSQSDLRGDNGMRQAQSARCLHKSPTSPRTFFNGDSDLAQSMVSLQDLREALVQNYFAEEEEDDRSESPLIQEAAAEKPQVPLLQLRGLVHRQELARPGASREDDSANMPKLLGQQCLARKELKLKEQSHGRATVPSPNSDKSTTDGSVALASVTASPISPLSDVRGNRDAHQMFESEASQPQQGESIQQTLQSKIEAEQRRKQQLSLELSQRSLETESLRQQLKAAETKIDNGRRGRSISDAQVSPRLAKVRTSMPLLGSTGVQATPPVPPSNSAIGRSSTHATLHGRQSRSPRQDGLKQGGVQGSMAPPRCAARVVSPRLSEPKRGRAPLRNSSSQAEGQAYPPRPATKTAIAAKSPPVGGASGVLNRVSSTRGQPTQVTSPRPQVSVAAPKKLGRAATSTNLAPSVATKESSAADKAIAALTADLCDWVAS